MLDSIRAVAQGWVGKLLLALITIPFALFGIDSYLKSAGSNASVAEVGDESISIQTYDNALKNMRDRLQMQGKVDPAQLDSPEVKAMVLNQLIHQQLLAKEVKDANFAISDMQLSTYITGMPEFQKDGKFSQEVYDQLLTSNQLTPTRFEASMRQDLLQQQAQDGIAKLGFLTNQRLNQALSQANQKRVVSVAEIKAKNFISEVKVDPAQVQSYYDKHKEKLVVPEKVKLEFLLLSASGLIPSVKVESEEIKKYYEENAAKYQGDEQRRASHILIGFSANATPAQKQEAKAKAQDILAQVKKNPKQFESLAAQYSQDPGSATKGGDLGSFARGAMVKPFEDAAFSMKVDQISDLVESEFGYHIIKVTEVTGQSKDFDSLKPQIMADLMYQKAQLKYAEQAESFSNYVYEHSDGLASAAKEFGIQTQTSDWMSREDVAKFFKSDKVMNLVFSDEVLKDRRNSEAVEVSPYNTIAARVIDYKAAAPRSFDEVKGGIEDFLKGEAALKMAIEKGQAALKELQSGKEVAGLEWIPEVTVSRKQAEGLTELAMKQVFKTSVEKFPSYSGLSDSKQGYLIVKVLNVQTPDLENSDDLSVTKPNVETAVAEEYVAAYKKSLKDKADVKVNERLLLEKTSE
jgi:peptidyl-prolyl cis-trans isomerase D